MIEISLPVEGVTFSDNSKDWCQSITCFPNIVNKNSKDAEHQIIHQTVFSVEHYKASKKIVYSTMNEIQDFTVEQDLSVDEMILDFFKSNVLYSALEESNCQDWEFFFSKTFFSNFTKGLASILVKCKPKKVESVKLIFDAASTNMPYKEVIRSFIEWIDEFCKDDSSSKKEYYLNNILNTMHQYPLEKKEPALIPNDDEGIKLFFGHDRYDIKFKTDSILGGRMFMGIFLYADFKNKNKSLSLKMKGRSGLEVCYHGNTFKKVVFKKEAGLGGFWSVCHSESLVPRGDVVKRVMPRTPLKNQFLIEFQKSPSNSDVPFNAVSFKGDFKFVGMPLHVVFNNEGKFISYEYNFKTDDREFFENFFTINDFPNLNFKDTVFTCFIFNIGIIEGSTEKYSANEMQKRDVDLFRMLYENEKLKNLLSEAIAYHDYYLDALLDEGIFHFIEEAPDESKLN